MKILREKPGLKEIIKKLERGQKIIDAKKALKTDSLPLAKMKVNENEMGEIVERLKGVKKNVKSGVKIGGMRVALCSDIRIVPFKPRLIDPRSPEYTGKYISGDSTHQVVTNDEENDINSYENLMIDLDEDNTNEENEE